MGRYDTDKIVKEILKLQTEEFLGVCKILGVSLVEKEEDKGRDFEDIWADVVDKLGGLNRVKRKNLMKLLRAANEDR